MQPVCEALPAPANTRTPGLFFREKDLEVRLVRDDRDLAAAQRLRREILNREMREGWAGSLTGALDRDAFDAYCDHLLVIDRRTGSALGAYRLLSSDRVPSFGFQSEQGFHLDNIRRQGMRLLELGRNCLPPDHRAGRVIQLLFRGIAVYAQLNKADTLIGWAGIRSDDIDELRGFDTLLRRRYPCEPAYRVTPKRGFKLPGLESPVEIDESEVFKKLPTLFKYYLHLGATVCGPPAFDRRFGTMDYFIRIPTTEFVERVKRWFFVQRNLA